MPEMIPEDTPGLADQAVNLLRAGALVVYPTDTLYGLGTASRNEEAVRRLFSVKGRPPSQGLPLLVSGPVMAEWVASVTPIGHTLMSAFWPGGLTIVMRRNESFHSAALAGGDTVALRAPDRRIVLDMIHGLGEPITGTSANRSGSRPPSSAAEIAFLFGDMVALVIDGGPVGRGVESTIIDITESSRPLILREGAVSREIIESTLGRPVA